MKYIIEIEDKPFTRQPAQSALYGVTALYRAKGFNSLVFDSVGLTKLKPFEKELEEAYQRGFEAGQQKVGDIRVGDEVEAYSGRAIVFDKFARTDGTDGCIYWYPDKKRFDRDKVENLRKTGGYFPQVVEMFKALDGEQRNCPTCGNTNPIYCDACLNGSQWESKKVTK